MKRFLDQTGICKPLARPRHRRLCNVSKEVSPSFRVKSEFILLTGVFVFVNFLR